MDFVIPISCIVSALIAAYSSYQATKKAAEERSREFERLMNERDISITSEIAALSAKVDILSERVEKHNNLIERTYKLEADVQNLTHRLDEML